MFRNRRHPTWEVPAIRLTREGMSWATAPRKGCRQAAHEPPARPSAPEWHSCDARVGDLTGPDIAHTAITDPRIASRRTLPPRRGRDTAGTALPPCSAADGPAALGSVGFRTPGSR